MEQSDPVLARRRIVGRLSVAAIAVGAALGVFGIAASAAPVPQTGNVTVTETDALAPLNSGGSATPFTLLLPTNSKCSKDTTTGQYHVYTYITGEDPATLTFLAGTGPQSTTGTTFQLYDNNGTPAIDQNTGVGGFISQEPTLDLALFSPDGNSPVGPGSANVLPVGTYNVGIACADNVGGLDRFWNVQLVFTASTTDPNHEVWAVKDVTVAPPTTPTTDGSGATTSSSTVAPTTSSSSVSPTTTSSTVAPTTTTTSSSLPATATATTPLDPARLAVTGTGITRLLDWAVILLLVGTVGSYLAHRRRDIGGGR